MAGEGPPSTTFPLAPAKSWMPTFVGMTGGRCGIRVGLSVHWYQAAPFGRSRISGASERSVRQMQRSLTVHHTFTAADNL